MNDQARAALAKVGWSENRRIPTESIAESMQSNGFTMFPAARAFLERYGDLSVLAEPRPLEVNPLYFHTDVRSVPADPSWIEHWEEASGTRMFPVGETAFGDYVLIMDEHGRVFGMDTYLQMSYWADDAEQLFDVVVGGGETFRPVEPEDRWPMRVHRFGATDRLAIDIDVEPDDDRQGVAFLALWAGGLRLGATDQTEQLSTFLCSLARFLDAVPSAPPEFAALPADRVFADVVTLLTDKDPTRSDFPWSRSDLYQNMLLLPNGCAPFDGEWAILLREPARDRLITRRFGDATVREVILDPGEVEATARAVMLHPWHDSSRG